MFVQTSIEYLNRLPSALHVVGAGIRFPPAVRSPPQLATGIFWILCKLYFSSISAQHVDPTHLVYSSFIWASDEDLNLLKFTVTSSGEKPSGKMTANISILPGNHSSGVSGEAGFSLIECFISVFVYLSCFVLCFWCYLFILDFSYFSSSCFQDSFAFWIDNSW